MFCRRHSVGVLLFMVYPANCTRVRTLSPDPTIEEEVFDRLYITLSTTKISKYITPSITYYQTIYSWGAEPTHDGTLFYAPVRTPTLPLPELNLCPSAKPAPVQPAE